MKLHFINSFLREESGDAGGPSILETLMNNAAKAGGSASFVSDNLEEPETPEAGLNDDGTIKEGYIKADNGTVIKIPEGMTAEGELQEGYELDPDTGIPKKIEQQQNDETKEETDFFAEVEKITGKQFKIELPEGIDPTSPQGVAAREKAIFDTARREFEEQQRLADPVAFAYKAHRAAGGTDADFFQKPHVFKLPEKSTLGESVETQTAVYRHLLTKFNNLPEDAANVLVDTAIKNNKLAELSGTAYDTINAAQQKEMEDVIKREKDEETNFINAAADLRKNIKESAEKMRFIVPATEMESFQKFVEDNIVYNNGQWFSVQPVSELNSLLEAMLFQFKKGDLSKIVEIKAGTKNAQSLRLKMGSAGAGGTGNQQQKNEGSTVSLHDFWGSRIKKQ